MDHNLLNLLPNHNSDKPTGSIASVVWDTTLDEQDLAHRLQEQLSHWSNNELNAILEQSFQQYCPTGQTWRIDTLELDLGEIAFDELSTELPKRVQDCLARQLKQLLQSTGEPIDDARTDDLSHDGQIYSVSQSLNEYIDYFLQTGVAPWWYTGTQSNQEILQQQLLNAPHQVAAIIRQLGRAQVAVRKRIAAQYSARMIKKIITVLEPQNHPYIIEFSENLLDLQATTHQPKSDSKLFERQTWFWILTHLLVERGSFFNTVMFVESTLKQMAHYYQLDFHELLQQLITAAQSLAFKGHAPPTFIQALLVLQQKKPAADTAQVETDNRNKPEFWAIFQRGLHSGQEQSVTSAGVRNMTELFSLLVDLAPEQMVDLLIKEGQEAKVRQKLIRLLTEAELSRIVQLLSPQNHLFILAYAQQSHEVFAKHKADQQVVWDVILAYLLKNSGGYFNRREFIDTTLQEISRSYGISYLMLLDMLRGATISHQGYAERYELLAILTDLRQQHQPSVSIAPPTDADYFQALAAYLTTGQAVKAVGNRYLPTMAQLFEVLLYRYTPQLASTIAELFNNNPILQSSREQQARTDRLLELIPPADYALVLRHLNRPASRFALNLIDYLKSRQQQLPSLRGFDLNYRLYGLVLKLLTGQAPANLSTAQFLTAFFAEFGVCHGVNRQALAVELGACLSQDSNSNPFSRDETVTLNQWLADNTTTLATVYETGNVDINSWSAAQKINAILCYLRADKTALQKMGLVESNAGLAKLLAAILPEHTELLLDRLQQQTDRRALAVALIKQTDRPEVSQCLGSLSAIDRQLAPKLLTEWQNVISQSGLWRGSSAVLQQKLHDIFWLSILDQALIKRGGVDQQQMDKLLAQFVLLSCQQLHIGLEPLLTALHHKQLIKPASPWHPAVTLLASRHTEPSPLGVSGTAIGKIEQQTQPPCSINANRRRTGVFARP